MMGTAATTSPIVLGLDAEDPSVRAGFFAHHGLWAPGVRMFRALPFGAKALVISLALVVPLLLLLAWQLQQQFEAAMLARSDSARQGVEIVVGIVERAHADELAGRLDKAQAQRRVLDAIAALRYDRGNYFWINDLQPRVVMHPIKPELDGQDVSGYKDPSGLAMFAAFAARVRQDGKGWVRYQWPHPGGTQPVDKLAYVQGFAPWGWVIGTGVYVDDVRAAARRQVSWVGGVVSVSLLVAGYLFVSFYRVMEGGLNETRRHLRAMTAGDLTTSPSPWGRDEAAQLMLELRAMQDSLRGMVLRVRCSSHDIVHSSSEIASGAMDLSARTEQAASNLQQSAASMEQIVGAIGHSAGHSAEASGVAAGNETIARAGGDTMRKVVETMEGIRHSSERIGDIIGTVDAIAFQTNILALNAAVEAARAGAQGRGFAVVAAEVRTLAARAAQAAHEIRGLVGTAVQQAEVGATVVGEAGQTMEEIVTSSHRVNGLLGEIAGASREQSHGVSQIGQALSDLDRMTQQNAALVEETAASAAAMKAQAESLAKEVDRFQLPASVVAGEEAEEPGNAPQDFDFDKAVEAHRHWKVKLRQAIAEQGRLDADTICRDDRCPLGQWLHGNGGQRWGAKPGFRALLDKHARFHAVAGGVARRINAGALPEAERLIGAGSDFARVSNEVCALLLNGKRGF